MAWRFNPPPNWPPPPPGWSPPPGWEPDPSWGPAPEGHVFWLDDLTGRPAWVVQATADADSRAEWLSLGNGLAATALVVAGASLLFSWVPIINNVVFFGALFALVVAVPAVMLTWSARASGRAMGIAAIIVSVLAAAVVLISQAFYGSLFF